MTITVSIYLYVIIRIMQLLSFPFHSVFPCEAEESIHSLVRCLELEKLGAGTLQSTLAILQFLPLTGDSRAFADISLTDLGSIRSFHASAIKEGLEEIYSCASHELVIDSQRY